MKILDFNELTQTTLVLRFQDDAKTVVHVSAPTVDLVDELRKNAAQLQEALTGKGDKIRPVLYHLAARLINCNLDGITVTAEELVFKYGMSQVALHIFFEEYAEYLGKLSNEKN